MEVAVTRTPLVLTLALVLGCTQTTPIPNPSPDISSPTAATALARTGLSHITRLQIDKVESPAFEGRSFGDVGQYEKLVGRAFGVADPTDPIDAGIVDLARAPKNAQGLVEYDVDFFLLKPINVEKGNKSLFYDVVNRGNKNLVTTFNIGAANANNPTKATDAGDGLLMNMGYAMVWSGWQGDVLPGNDRLGARFPVAVNADGSPIHRKIDMELVFEQANLFTVPVSWDRGADVKPYPAYEPAMASATLSRRFGADGESVTIARDQWSFDKCPDGKTKTTSNVDICYPAGFSTDFVYDLVYEARDPAVMGLAFAGTRDIVSFLRYDQSDGNPLVAKGSGKNAIQWSFGFGSSQSGRFLKDLIYQGFNQDGKGRRVFDGAIPHKPGSRKTYTNYEFAAPGRFSTQLEGHHTPGDQFPFAYSSVTDPVTGKTDSVLARCLAQNACPKIMHFDTGLEFWSARSSLVSTDPKGTADLVIPDNVRLYLFSSTQHGPAATPAKGICQNLTNPLRFEETMRSLMVSLYGWVTKDTPPPASRWPRISDGTLVQPTAIGFPSIPGLKFTGRVNHLSVVDYTAFPPRHVSGQDYRVLVPKVDADGNDIAGIRSAQLSAPLGTYTGWNLRAKGFMEDEGCYLNGSYVPFAQTAAQRKTTNDPRQSLEERYGSRQKYVDTLDAAAKQLVSGRYLLQEDADRLVKAAQTTDLGSAVK
ncbi:MAG: hypothetical protein AUH85_11420 [Chloroflexi bacterium 13_1_40CM_4_68_4]|nr:MAG: hypothetical protein AUH85_11420 [Chloroflexi bacterium 13_1_40CM_4_68_4]